MVSTPNQEGMILPIPNLPNLALVYFNKRTPLKGKASVVDSNSSSILSVRELVVSTKFVELYFSVSEVCVTVSDKDSKDLIQVIFIWPTKVSDSGCRIKWRVSAAYI